MPIGRRPRLQGGVNFLSPLVQAQALQAQWVSTFLTRPTVWSDAFHWVMDQQPGGTTLLASTMRHTLIAKFPVRWHSILSAWAKLRPHWNPDLSAWSVAQALQYRLTSSSSARNPEGVPLRLVIDLDSITQRFVLISDSVATDRFTGQAPTRSSPLCNVFVTTLNLSKRYSSNPFVPNPTPSLPLPLFALS